MSRDYGRVRTQFWGDEKVVGLQPLDRYTLLYLLLSPHSNAIGCFRLPPSYASEDTGMTEDEFAASFSRVEAAGIAVMQAKSFIWVPNYLRHNPPENPNVWRKCVKELQALPRTLGCIRTIAAALVVMSGDKRMKGLSDEERASMQAFLDGLTEVPATVSKGLADTQTTVDETVQETVSETVSETVDETVPATVSKGLAIGSPPNLTLPDLSEPNLTGPSVSKDTGVAADLLGGDPTPPAAKASTKKPKTPAEEARARLYADGRRILGDNAGGMVTNLLEVTEGNVAKANWLLSDAAKQTDPRSWLVAAMMKRAKGGQDVWGLPGTM